MKQIREARQLALEIFPKDDADFETEYAIDSDFPEEFANNLSRLEAYNKHLFRPNTYLHKWWARRCGSTFRTILKQFVRSRSQRDYYAAKGLDGKVVLDPMMGGGTTLHEAIRLGANVIGADIDPIPIIQARATLSPIRLSEITASFEQFMGKLQTSVAEYFRTECPTCDVTLDSQYTLYGQRKQCNCREVVQIEQFDLRHEANRVIRIWPGTWAITDTATEPDRPMQPMQLITRDQKACDKCGEPYREMLNLPYYKRYTPFAVAGICTQHGFFFRSPGPGDKARLDASNDARESVRFGEALDFSIKGGPKSDDLIKRNIVSYLDLFTSRQLLFLAASIEALQHLEGTLRDNLALLVSTGLEFNSLLCGYKGWAQNRPGAIRHVFAHHAYSFPYTAAENNPVNVRKSSGNLRSLFQDRIVRGRKWSSAPVERKIDQGGQVKLVPIKGEYDSGTEVFDAAQLEHGSQHYLLLHGTSIALPLNDDSVDFVVTDPPYYDSVQYSDLAEFFRVWLAKLLPDEVNWHYDQSQSAVASKHNLHQYQYLNAMTGVFQECARVLKESTGRMVFTYHHWDANAWADITIALRIAGLQLVNMYTVFSENPISIHIQNLNAIKHDTILVLRHRNLRPTPRWQPIDSIQTSDSETFCRNCGQVLGWLLDCDLTDDEIRKIWKGLIRMKN